MSSLHGTTMQFIIPLQTTSSRTEPNARRPGDISLVGTQREFARSAAGTIAVDKCSSSTLRMRHYQYCKQHRSRSNDTAYKRYGGRPNIFGHYNHKHIYHTTGYGLLEGNPCSSYTNDELRTTLTST